MILFMLWINNFKEVPMKTILVFVTMIGSSAFAQNQNMMNPNHPCAPIVKVCKAAQPPYIVGQAKEGNGVFMDCVKPLVDSNGKTIPPRVNPALVAQIPPTAYAACKAAKPKM